jgi:hypothetical protein
VGLQGRLVCSNEYVDTIVDFNKSESGYESCVVGQNNLTELDAYKAAALLKNKMRKKSPHAGQIPASGQPYSLRRLTRKSIPVKEVRFGPGTRLERGVLTIRAGLEEGILAAQPRLAGLTLSLLSPSDHHRFVNSNLDFMPIAAKAQGTLGEGVTHLLDGVTLMLTGAEQGGFQPSNIGSSEGILSQQVVFDQAGTPKSTDILLHVDCLLKEGEGRTAEGIQAAHAAADMVLQEIRAVMTNTDNMAYHTEDFYDVVRPGKPKVLLIKIVSGLGNMYDTALFPREPGGCLGARQMMSIRNMPVYLTANQCRDGAIHSLL